ncbi:MAG TPA: hypothetical protein DCZ74_03170 [Treponema sp.]|nr:hypothetical protein [Treponema sp.]
MNNQEIILWLIPLFLGTVVVTRICIELFRDLIEILIQKIDDYRFEKMLNKTPEKDLIITKDQQKELFAGLGRNSVQGLITTKKTSQV